MGITMLTGTEGRRIVVSIIGVLDMDSAVAVVVLFRRISDVGRDTDSASAFNSTSLGSIVGSTAAEVTDVFANMIGVVSSLAASDVR
jgi:hypothetical protein